MNPSVHNYSMNSGQTLFWDTSDNEQTFQKNLQIPEKKKLLQELGYINNPILYKFNSHGFRTEEFDQKFDVVCFGCSFTMGTGVHVEHTWPNQLANLTNLKIVNLGHAGSSNDTAFRMANYYLEFLKPKFAIWLQTDRHRLEIINDQDHVSINILASDNDDWYSNNFFVKTWMTSETNQNLNLIKNTRAFVNLCNDLNIVPIVLPRNKVIRQDFGRDLVHPGQNSYRKFAEQVAINFDI